MQHLVQIVRVLIGGVALIAVYVVPGIDGAVVNGLGAVGDRPFSPFFFAGGNVYEWVARSHQQTQLFLKTHHSAPVSEPANEPAKQLSQPISIK